MAENTISRANYFDGQFLRTQDFRDEQSYQIAMRRRHNIAQHTWGIVRGLEVCWDDTNQQFIIQSGIAIDGYGRELIAPEGYFIDTPIFDIRGSDILDIYLVYNLRESDPAPRGYRGCLPDGTSPTGSFYRTQEEAILRIEMGELDVKDRRAKPTDVPPEDWQFSASRTPPDNPLQDWPVFLGQIQRNPADQKQAYQVDMSARPYVGLVGSVIQSPLEDAKIQIGKQNTDDPRSFAVFLKALKEDGAPKDEDEQKKLPQPQFEIDEYGKTTIQGSTTVHGELQINAGAVEITAGPESEKPHPWQMYHIPYLTNSKNETTRIEEIRIELPEYDGKDASKAQFVIGSWSAKQSKFIPCLTIDNECNVTINGTLKLERVTDQNDHVIDVSKLHLSDDAVRMITSSLLSGVGAATGIVADVYQRPVDPVILEKQGLKQASVVLQRTAHISLTPDEIAQQLIAIDPDKAKKVQNAIRRNLGKTPPSEGIN